MALDATRGQIILFSGSTGASPNDTWAWDGRLWTQVADSGPSWRQLAGMAHDLVTGSLLLFGGFASPGPFPET